MISAVIKYKDNKVSVHSSEAQWVGEKFQKGFYRALTIDSRLEITEITIPEIHNPFSTKDTNLVITTTDAFFKEGIRERVSQLGFIHKLGVLLHGKQGCGKTSLMHFIAKRMVEMQDAIVIMCDSSNSLSTGIQLASSIREIQNNPIIFISDEFEQYCRDAESALKNFLDGKDSVENSLFLAATNYIDKVPDTLKDRPSRFKLVMNMKGIDNKKLMKTILMDISHRIHPNLFTIEEVDEIVKGIKETTLDKLKHICLDKVTDTFIPEAMLKRASIGFKSSSINEEEEEVPVINWGWLFSKSKSQEPTNTKSNI